MSEVKEEFERLVKSLFHVFQAAALKRNTVIDPEYDADYAKKFVGRWIAVPEEDFNNLRAAVVEARERLKESSRKNDAPCGTP